MKIHRPGSLCLALLVALAVTGCDPKQEASAESAHGEHEEEAPSGASYKDGKGVLVKDETKSLMGLETAEVTEKTLARSIEFTTQVYRAAGHGVPVPWLATGTLPASRLTGARVGQEVTLRADDGTTFNGRLQKLYASSGRARDEAEAVVSFTGPSPEAQPALFLQATLTLPGTGKSLTVPRSAVLRTAEGSFVYAVNGEAYQRTAVKTGAEADGLVEITDGLLEGDSVVTRPVESLYLVELRATKGGGHSH